jgi:MSHA pilin protein MshD
MRLNTIRHCPSSPARTGLTLVESVISVVIVSVMLVAALSTLGSAAHARQRQHRQSQGAPLAHQLMAEILQLPYEEPSDGTQTMDDGEGGVVVLAPSDPPDTPTFGRESSESGGARNDWDDVDDYHGWSASPPETKDAIELTAYTGWTREVSVKLVNPTMPGVISVLDLGLKHITVTVTDPEGRKTSLSALRSRVGAYEYAPSEETTSMTGVMVELRLNSDEPPWVSGTVGLNQLAVDGGS